MDNPKMDWTPCLPGATLGVLGGGQLGRGEGFAGIAAVEDLEDLHQGGAVECRHRLRSVTAADPEGPDGLPVRL